MLKVFVVLFFLVLPSSGFALSLQAAFDTLKQNEIDYEAKGTICEQVANLVVEEIYPQEDYEILNGITYKNTERVVGELDVVVLERQSQKVILVAEVKCWKDLTEAQQKAIDQRARFVKHLRSGKELWINLEKRSFERSQFQEAKYLSIGNKGALSSGFDLELPFTMPELMKLRQSLFQCFKNSMCEQRL